MEDNSLIQYVNNGSYTQGTLEVFLIENDTNVNKIIKQLFKISTNNYKDYSIDDITLSNIIDFLTYLFENNEFDEEEIDINKSRLQKLLQYLDDKYTQTRNPLYTLLKQKAHLILIDKRKNIDEIKRLITLLIDKKESIHVIRAIIADVKGIASDGSIFNYVFNILLRSNDLKPFEALYYIELLKIFYSKNIDRKKYSSLLDSIKCLDDDQLNEIYNIIFGKQNSLDPKQVDNKFDLSQKLMTAPLIARKDKLIGSSEVITFDTNVLNIKDDGISIKKDGNLYVVGLHMSDVGAAIEPESLLDIQARNITKDIYLTDRKIEMIPHSTKEKLSLDRGARRGSISLYVVMNKHGQIVDYFLANDDISVRVNLTYRDAERIIKAKKTDSFGKRVQMLYEFSDILRKNSVRNKKYITAKENKIGGDLYRTKSFLMISEFMILYNSLIPAIANEKGIPFIYRGKDRSYIPDLIRSENIELDDDSFDKASSVFLDSYYSSSPAHHMTLGKKYYSTCSAPMRKYSALYSQYLLHMFYFKNKSFDFSDKRFECLVEYLNDRNREIDLYKECYERSLKR